MRVRKNTRNFCAPARTAINHIISVNGACKTREGSASLCSFVYNTREERNTSGRMSDPNHVLRGTRVLEGGGARGRGEERSREALPDVQQLLPEDGWNNMGVWIVRDESRVVFSTKQEAGRRNEMKRLISF